MKFNLRGVRTAAAGAITTLLTLAIAGLIVIYSGAYNVAATSGHTVPGRWVLETTMRNSVQTRAASIQAPATHTAAAITAGGSEYKAMCQHCHGGPGVQRAEWAAGIVPSPPSLTLAGQECQPNEIFWIVKHGVKMTGMPAFGPTHDDETVWNIAAFVGALPQMTAEQYAAVPSGHANNQQSSGSNHSAHAH